MSFAPLAARLAARAAEIRPASGARNDWDKIGAMIVCLVLEMLICLCEALDARAAAEARAVTVPAPRAAKAASVQASRAGRQAPWSERRAPWLALVPEIHAITPEPAATLSGTTERPAPTGPWLACSRDPGPIQAVLAPPWRPAEKRGPSPCHQAHLYC